MRILLALAFTFPLLAEDHKKEEHVATTKFYSQDFEKTDKAVQTPVELVKEIENQYLDLLKKEKLLDDAALKQAKNQIPRSFLSTDIFLEQKTEGVLKRNALYSMENTGGVIDLGQILTTRPGSFHVKVAPKSATDADLSKIKVYFLSNSPERKIIGETWGSGCGKLFDVTRFFHEKMRKDGLLAVTSEQRHLAVLGGTFYLILTTTDGLQLATLSFVDRRFPKDQCIAL